MDMCSRVSSPTTFLSWSAASRPTLSTLSRQSQSTTPSSAGLLLLRYKWPRTRRSRTKKLTSSKQTAWMLCQNLFTQSKKVAERPLSSQAWNHKSPTLTCWRLYTMMVSPIEEFHSFSFVTLLWRQTTYPLISANHSSIKSTIFLTN